jgi:enoyl-CoA hydratase/carnithine racemase
MDSLITSAGRAFAAGFRLGALEAASPTGVKADQPYGPLHV